MLFKEGKMLTKRFKDKETGGNELDNWFDYKRGSFTVNSIGLDNVGTN